MKLAKTASMASADHNDPTPIGRRDSAYTSRVRYRFYSLVAACTLGAGGCSSYDPLTEPVAPGRQALREASGEEAAFIELLNAYRDERGLAAIYQDRALNQVAYDFSIRMGREDFFDHKSPDGGTFGQRMCSGGYVPACQPLRTYIGENIAAGQDTAAAVFEAWRNSPGHNANMLKPEYRVMGIAYAPATTAEYDGYWTNDFAGQIVDTTIVPGTEPPDAGPPDPQNQDGSVRPANDARPSDARPANASSSRSGCSVTTTKKGHPIGHPFLLLSLLCLFILSDRGLVRRHTRSPQGRAPKMGC